MTVCNVIHFINKPLALFFAHNRTAASLCPMTGALWPHPHPPLLTLKPTPRSLLYLVKPPARSGTASAALCVGAVIRGWVVCTIQHVRSSSARVSHSLLEAALRDKGQMSRLECANNPQCLRSTPPCHSVAPAWCAPVWRVCHLSSRCKRSRGRSKGFRDDQGSPCSRSVPSLGYQRYQHNYHQLHPPCTWPPTMAVPPRAFMALPLTRRQLPHRTCGCTLPFLLTTLLPPLTPTPS